MESGESLFRGRSEHRLTSGFAAARRRRGTVLMLAVLAAVTMVVGTAVAQEAVPAGSSGSLSEGGLSGLNAAEAQRAMDVLKSSDYNSATESVSQPNDIEPLKPVVRTPAQGPSATERLIAGDIATEVSTNLQQFGYDVFTQSVSTFAPVTNVPVGPDYVIGPGDSFRVTLWGRVDAQFVLQVDRNGQVIVPEVGALRVWGMKFGEMEDYLQHELSRKYTDFRMSVTMDRLRVIRVFVVGEAAVPGSYTISSLSTVINALVAAGGPSKNGSLREIQLRRNGAEPVMIDLYDFLLGGDRSGDVRLQDGDTIFIPLIGPVVGVAGNVKRPAIYEMSGSMTLGDVLDDLAGGVTFAGWLQRVQVERIEDHRKRIVVDFDLADSQDNGSRTQPLQTIVQDGDVVKIFSVRPGEQDIVRLEGHVVRPGKYEWKPGMHLGDILTSYDVFLPQPNLDYGQIERLVPPDLHATFIPFSPGRLLAGDAEREPRAGPVRHHSNLPVGPEKLPDRCDLRHGVRAESISARSRDARQRFD